MIDLAYVGAGAVTGFIVGLTGVGGGAIMTPILLLLFGINPISAVATDLWFAAITKIAILIIYNKKKQIDWPIVRKLWLGSIPISLFILCAMSFGVFDKIAGSIPKIIGGVILLTTFCMLFSNWLKKEVVQFRSLNVNRFKALQPPLTIGAGAFIGALVSLTSVGAGTLGTVILFYLYPFRLTSYKLISTEVAHAIPLAIFVGLGYLWMGEVNFPLLGNLLLGSIPAACLGAFSAHKFKDQWLKIILAIVLCAASIKLFQQ